MTLIQTPTHSHGERRIGQARAAARGSQFLDYAFHVLYTLLGVRLVLALIAANRQSRKTSI